jgi:hypothetical protein
MFSQTVSIVVLMSKKMKRILPIILLLIGFACSKPTPKADGLIMKVRYQPESRYLISTIRGTETVITYSGQEIAMQKLKSMNIKNPTISKVKTKTDTELVTAGRLKDKSYGATLIYKKTNSIDGKNEVPEGTFVYGTIKNGHLPTFHAIASDILDFDQKTQLMQIVRNTFDQFDFPEKQLKIGEQFSMDRPVSLPMEGSVIETVITTTYKLIGIKNGTAQFSISQSYLMSPKMMDNSFKGSGKGNGQLNYSIKDSLVTDYSLKTELDLNKKLDYFEFDLKTINEFNQTTQIVKQ